MIPDPELTPDRKRRDDRIWLYVAVAFAFFWGTYLVFFNPERASDAPDLAGSGLPIPADFGWTPTDVDGNPVPFSKFEGKPIFLNIWATWCGPCIAEMPSVAKLAANPRLKGKVEFVCVATDDRREVVKRFAADQSWPMTVLHTRSLPDVFLTQGIPATFLIAPSGKVVAHQVGSAVWDSPEVVDFLEQMIKK